MNNRHVIKIICRNQPAKSQWNSIALSAPFSVDTCFSDTKRDRFIFSGRQAFAATSRRMYACRHSPKQKDRLATDVRFKGTWTLFLSNYPVYLVLPVAPLQVAIGSTVPWRQWWTVRIVYLTKFSFCQRSNAINRMVFNSKKPFFPILISAAEPHHLMIEGWHSVF
jgi:hypothetical protein